MKTRFLPLIVFAGLVVIFAVLLLSGKDPSKIPSALVGKPAPGFELASFNGKPFASADLKHAPAVVNIFASWCVSCAGEQEELAEIGAAKFTVYGIAYKDKKPALKAWLAKHGNPYAKIGMDDDGHAAIDWGVYGVPETYVIDKDGIVRYRHVGPLTMDDVEGTLLPLLKELGQ